MRAQTNVRLPNCAARSSDHRLVVLLKTVSETGDLASTSAHVTTAVPSTSALMMNLVRGVRMIPRQYSDPAHRTRGLQPERDGRVRCACLGVTLLGPRNES